jgi:undecaprenyl diphosphate synthase
VFATDWILLSSQENLLTLVVDQPSDFPRHVAIIMDGNGRWARRRMLPRLEGHRQGAKSVRRAVEFCRRNGIGYLTLYAFSTENWQRPRSEVSGLMKLLSQFLDSELEEIHSNDVRLKTIGQLNRLPATLVTKIEAAKAKTSANKSMVLNIALSYGGRQDIVNAGLKVARAIRSGILNETEVTEEVYEGYLDTAGLPDPDLLIRTGGELRISNFLLWQAAYAELYFTETLWPDFDDDAFMQAVEAYRSRQRRFGMISEQIEAGEKVS